MFQIFLLLVTVTLSGKKKKQNKKVTEEEKIPQVQDVEKSCHLRHYLVNETKHESSCSTIYKKECTTKYRTECFQEPHTTNDIYCEHHNYPEITEQCLNEVGIGECNVDGHSENCYLDVIGPKLCRQAIRNIQARFCAPVARKIFKQKCKKHPVKECIEVPTRVCTTKPATAEKKTSNKICV